MDRQAHEKKVEGDMKKKQASFLLSVHAPPLTMMVSVDAAGEEWLTPSQIEVLESTRSLYLYATSQPAKATKKMYPYWRSPVMPVRSLTASFTSNAHAGIAG